MKSLKLQNICLRKRPQKYEVRRPQKYRIICVTVSYQIFTRLNATSSVWEQN